MAVTWCMVPEIWSAMDRIFVSFWTLFCKSAKSRACHACVLGCIACLHACMPMWLACLCASVFSVLVCFRAYVLPCLACLFAFVLGVLTCLTCLRVWHAYILGVLACMRACYDEMFYILMCLCTWYAFLSYLLYISILKFKNSYSEKFVCFVKLNIFLIYILISTYKTIWNQFKGSRKVNRYII